MKMVRLAVLALLILVVADARTQDGIYPYFEYRKRVEATQNLSPLDNGLFGESTSLYNGSTEFRVVDIDLPGNNELAVQLARRIEIQVQPQSLAGYDTRLGGIGNWYVDIPYIAATYPYQQQSGWTGCSGSSGGLEPPLTLGYFNRQEYWSGASVHLPGRGTTSLLHHFSPAPAPSDGVQYRYATSERDMLSCTSMQSGFTGEGFMLVTSSGLRYYFDVSVVRDAATLMKKVTGAGGIPLTKFLPRKHYYVLASKIEDRFGNTVQFQYNTLGHPTRIWSGDGREITFSYANGRLSTATAHGRTWQYQYDANGDLQAVTLPDASQWQYAYTGTLLPRAGVSENPGQWAWCSQDPMTPGYKYYVQATHPSGAVGAFVFLNIRHYRSGVHATECMETRFGPNAADYDLMTPHYSDVMSLSSKSIGGPGIATSTWSYGYGEASEGLWGTHTEPAIYPCTTCTPYKTVTVINPDGTRQLNRFGIVYWLNDGRLLQTETVSAEGAVLRREVSEYLSESEAANQAFYDYYGNVPSGTSDPATARVRPVVKKIVTQQGRDFTWRVDKTCTIGSATTYCFDALARPTGVVKSSAPTP